MVEECISKFTTLDMTFEIVSHYLDMTLQQSRLNRVQVGLCAPKWAGARAASWRFCSVHQPEYKQAIVNSTAACIRLTWLSLLHKKLGWRAQACQLHALISSPSSMLASS